MNDHPSSENAMFRDRNIALCRSILYETLSAAFRPPEEPAARVLARNGISEAMVRAAAVLDREEGGHLGALARRFALAVTPKTTDGSGAGSGREGDVSADPEAYRRLFGHTVRGPVPLFETEYGEGSLFQKPQEMSDLGGFFRAFGLRMSPDVHERIDHLSCELEFLAFVTRKEAHAIEIRDDSMAARAREAEAKFLVDHLARFVPAFARRLSGRDPGGFYGRAGELCREFVRFECERLGARLGAETLPLRVESDDGAPMACGSPDACGAAGCPPEPDALPADGDLLEIEGAVPDAPERPS